MVNREEEERNKFLCRKIGIDWHSHKDCNKTSFCLTKNPDFHTAEGRQVLLEWAVEQEWWNTLAYRNSPREATAWTGLIGLNLLIPVTALGDAVYEYLKRKEKGQVVDTHA